MEGIREKRNYEVTIGAVAINFNDETCSELSIILPRFTVYDCLACLGR